MQLRSDSFENGRPIPPEFAFGKRGDPVAHGGNCSPHLAWKDAPANTRSFVLTCIDPDAPGSSTAANQSGHTIPVEQPRNEFVHWLMADVPVECGELAAAACSDGVVAHGKHDPDGPPSSVQGRNGYTDYFADDAAMAGIWLGYDGPCPPWNDALVHRYRFTVHALDVASLGLDDGFDLAALRAAMSGHVLAQAQWIGTYSLNQKLNHE